MPSPAQWVFSGIIQWLQSCDPNAIVGPAGYGDGDFVNASSVLPYTIDFENSATATASSGEIQITHRLGDLRATLGDRMRDSPVMDAPHFARNVEAAYREMWRRWCASGWHQPRMDVILGLGLSRLIKRSKEHERC